MAPRGPGAGRAAPRPPAERVRIHLPGSAVRSAGAMDVSLQIHGSLLALHTSRPVKMVYDSRRVVQRATCTAIRRGSRCEHRGDPRGSAHLRPDVQDHPARRRRVRVELDRRRLQCGVVRGRPLPRRQRARRVSTAGLEQPAVRRRRTRAASARCRCASPPSPRWTCSPRSSGSTRSSLRRRTRSSPATCCRPGQVLTGSLPTQEVIRRAAAIPVPEQGGSAPGPAPPPGRRRRERDDPGARASAAASASRSGSRTSATRRDSTTSVPRGWWFCCGRRGRSAVVHSAAAEVGQGVVGVILQVEEPSSAPTTWLSPRTRPLRSARRAPHGGRA